MKYLIVGLGNIGAEYADTRHNIGFMVLDQLAKESDLIFKIERHAFTAELNFKSRSLHFIKPTTYMNLSGKAVNYWMQQLKIPLENVLIIVDDIALPLGRVQMRPKGGHAGHNGLRDMEAVLGTQEYARIRFGVGSDFPKGRQVDYVLGKFSKEEAPELPLLIDRSIEMIKSFATAGIGLTMTRLNK